MAQPGLQTRRQIRRLPHNRLLLSRARSNEIADYNQPGANANADLERFNAAQLANRFDERQSGTYRTLRVVLMGPRISKVDQHAIAHVLRYEPAKALNSHRDALLICRNDLAQNALFTRMQALALSKGHMSRL